MPKGPQGQTRPPDTIGTAIKVARIATGDVEDDTSPGKEYAREGGKKGGAARAQKLTADERRSIAQHAARVRWHK